MRTSLLAAAVTAALLCPRTSTAMDIEMFDLLMDEDQREYVEYLLDAARKVFIEMDREDAAEKIARLFGKVPAGADRPIGEGQMRDILERMRRFATEHGQPGPRFGEVETAVVQTFVNNGIAIPRQFQRNLDRHIKEKPFWPRRPLRNR